MKTIIPQIDALMKAIWDFNWYLKPECTRLLSSKQVDQLYKIHDSLHDTWMRLHKEEKPKGWRKGQYVRVVKKFEATRTPVPSVGTVGKVDRVFQNEYGWWIVVGFYGEFVDVEGTVWYPGNEPMNIWFKPDEIAKGLKQAV